MFIYVITNQINNKKYVGQTTKTIEKRFKGHIRASKNLKNNFIIYQAFRKHGIENFIIELLDTANNKIELNEKEVFWISKLQTFGTLGYNMTPGGNFRGEITPETIEKSRQSNIRRFLNNPELKLKAAEWGKMAVLTEEGREKKRQFMKGKQYGLGSTHVVSEEARKAISKAQKGKIVSKETKEKFKISRTGKGMGERNAMADPEKREKVRQSKLGRKKIYREDGTSYMSPRLDK